MENNEVMMNNEVCEEIETTGKKSYMGLLIVGGVTAGVAVLGRIAWKKLVQPAFDKAVANAVKQLTESGELNTEGCYEAECDESVEETEE